MPHTRKLTDQERRDYEAAIAPFKGDIVHDPKRSSVTPAGMQATTKHEQVMKQQGLVMTRAGVRKHC